MKPALLRYLLPGMSVADIKTLNQLLLATRDRYTPVTRGHTEEELRGWFGGNS
jgi:hypothetical protein